MHHRMQTFKRMEQALRSHEKGNSAEILKA
jgi:hypothetical protein